MRFSLLPLSLSLVLAGGCAAPTALTRALR